MGLVEKLNTHLKSTANNLNIDIDSVKFMQLIEILGVGVMAFIVNLIGGIDSLVQTLAIFIVIDTAIGAAVGLKLKEFRPSTLFKGFMKKVLMFAVVIMAVRVELMFPQFNGMLRNGVIVFFVAYEGSSIIENWIELGMPFPEFLSEMFEVAKKVSERKIKDIVDTIDTTVENKED